MSKAQPPYAANSDYTVQDICMDGFINQAPRPHPDPKKVTIGEKTSLVAERVFDGSVGPSPSGLVHTPNSYHIDPQQYKMDVPDPNSFGQKFRRINFVVRYAMTVLLIGLPFAIPVAVFCPFAIVLDPAMAESKQYHNLVYYLFAWLLVTWLCAVVSNIFIRALPHLFRFVAGWVNPVHRKYWRIFRTVRNPVTMVGCVIGSWISFVLVSFALLHLKTRQDLTWIAHQLQ